MAVGTYVSIIWNVNGLNTPVKTQDGRMGKKNKTLCCLPETYFRPRDTGRPKVKG